MKSGRNLLTAGGMYCPCLHGGRIMCPDVGAER